MAEALMAAGQQFPPDRKPSSGPDGVEHHDSILYHLYHTNPATRAQAHRHLHQHGHTDIITILNLPPTDPGCPHCTSGAP